MPPEQTAVTRDEAKNRTALIVTSVLTLVGVSLLTAGFMRDWGFLPMFWSGVMTLVAAAAAISGLAKKGGFAEAPCPACGATLKFIHPEKARTLACEACGVWSTGTQSMAVVALDHLDAEPVFLVAIPDSGGVEWLRDEDGRVQCPTCAKPAVGEVEIEASSGTPGLILPVSIQTSHKLQAPRCSEHDDGVALFIGEETELELGFRSHQYMQRFKAAQGPS